MFSPRFLVLALALLFSPWSASAIFVSESHPFLSEYTYCSHTSLGPWGGTAPFNLTVLAGLNTTENALLLETLLLNSQQTSISNWVVDVPAGQDISFVLTDRTGARLAANSKVLVSHEKCDTLLLRHIAYNNASVVISSASFRSSSSKGMGALAAGSVALWQLLV
ncbi:hypothetical protein BDY24DRAFT_397060 [Mrakia frigida]|uniref:uncharacterized protein n=1 Tax=Mrakia frigida TaxID=29902 RepID=UPI003FCC04A2